MISIAQDDAYSCKVKPNEGSEDRHSNGREYADREVRFGRDEYKYGVAINS